MTTLLAYSHSAIRGSISSSPWVCFHCSEMKFSLTVRADVAFLISNYFKRERRGAKQGESDMLYAELGGRRAAGIKGSFQSADTGPNKV